MCHLTDDIYPACDLQGDLYGPVHEGDVVWTLEEDRGRRHMCIVLTKLGKGQLPPRRGDVGGGEGLWCALLKPCSAGKFRNTPHYVK